MQPTYGLFSFRFIAIKVHVAFVSFSFSIGYKPLGIRILSITQPTRDELLSKKKLICFKLCSSLKRSNLTTVVVVFMKRRVSICNHITIRIQYLHASLKPCKYPANTHLMISMFKPVSWSCRDCRMCLCLFNNASVSGSIL